MIISRDVNARSVWANIKRWAKYLMSFAAEPRLSALPYYAVQLLGHLRYARYLVVSAISLGIDLASFLLMLQIDVPAVRASILGYSSGVVFHWLLASRLVFSDKIRSTAAARCRQKMLFATSAFVGLAITAAMIECGLQLGMAPAQAKLAAIAVSLHVTYLLRRTFIFN